MRHMQKDTGNVERYTLPFIVDTAREVMGSIQLDPASTVQANKTVKADRYFNQMEDGLKQNWEGESVWMNHPYSRKNNPLWIDKAINEVNNGNAKQLICITWASTSSNWWQRLLARADAICYPSVRKCFYQQDGESAPMKDASIFYLMPPDTICPRKIKGFIAKFSTIGTSHALNSDSWAN